jgi:hypothetical protein
MGQNDVKPVIKIFKAKHTTHRGLVIELPEGYEHGDEFECYTNGDTVYYRKIDRRN